MVLAPEDIVAVLPADYRRSEHIGNICKEHAAVLAGYMDFGFNCTSQGKHDSPIDASEVLLKTRKLYL